MYGQKVEPVPVRESSRTDRHASPSTQLDQLTPNDPYISFIDWTLMMRFEVDCERRFLKLAFSPKKQPQFDFAHCHTEYSEKYPQKK